MFKQVLKHIGDLSATQIVIGGVVIVGGGGLLYWAMNRTATEIPIKEDDEKLPDVKKDPVIEVAQVDTYDISEQSAADTFENNQSADLSLVLPPVSSAVAMTDVPTLSEDREMKVLYKIAETTTPATAVAVIEKHLANAKPEKKLRVLFLIDSIVKTIGGAYPSLFGLNIASSFSNAYEQLNEPDRAAMLKLRQTWTEVFDPMKLYGLDIQVELIDPQWPVDIPSTLKIMPAVSPSEFQGSRVNNDTLDVDSTNHDPSNAASTSVIEPSVTAIRKVFPMSLEEELELMAGTYQEIQEKKKLVITAAQEHERQIKKMRSKNKRKEKKANKGKRPL